MARDSSGPKGQPRYDALGVPADAADLTELGDYAALVGNRKALTSAQRQALSGSDRWVGLEVAETDTNLTYIYTAEGWRLVSALEEVGTFSYGQYYKSSPLYAPLRLTRQGKVGRLRGVITTNQAVNFPGGALFIMGTVPAGWRPVTEQTPFGPMVAAGSGAVSGWHQLTATGELQIWLMGTINSPGVNGIAMSVDLEWTIA